MDILKIQEKVRTGKKLTKKEETFLEEYENNHTENEFNFIINLNREMTNLDKKKVIEVCLNALKSLGYEDVDMSD
ncbi:MAG: hypothetical protein O8C61_05540 [Candidatus Methanoperedens sp.]|nr:hypothetical protein [Candidatus Methanoperedens sp.]